MQQTRSPSRFRRMSTDRRDQNAQFRQTASRDAFFSKLFTRGSTAMFLAISVAVAAVALGYTPLLHR
jgi:hypothetical protein